MRGSVAATRWRLGKRPELDGVRGLAIVLVMLAHVEVPGFRSGGGVAGVTIFFVLSGFLITCLLVEEFRDTGRLSLHAFYRRRVRRLLPALVALIVVVTAYEAVSGTGSNLAGDAFVALFYISNWFRASGGWIGLLSHTWSLAIEEQFYLVWPVVLLALRPVVRWRFRTLFVLAIAGAIGSIVERAVLWHGETSINRVYFSTDARADGLLLGCALALWLTSGRRLRCGWPAAIAAAVLLVASTTSTGLVRIYVIAPTLASIGGVLLIAYLVTGGRGRVFRLRLLCHTGRISYGLYLWHVPITWVLLPRLEGYPLPFRAAVILGLAYAFALASYRWVEQPYLRRKTARELRGESAPPLPVGSPARAA